MTSPTRRLGSLAAVLLAAVLAVDAATITMPLSMDHLPGSFFGGVE